MDKVLLKKGHHTLKTTNSWLLLKFKLKYIFMLSYSKIDDIFLARFIFVVVVAYYLCY